MGRGGGVSPKRNFKRGVRFKGTGSDDSDEDYVISDEENEVSACSDEDFISSIDGYASEASDQLLEEEEERKVRKKTKKVGRSKKLKKHYGRSKVEEEDKNEDEAEEEEEDEDEDEEHDEDEDYNEDEDEEMEEVKATNRLKGGFSSMHKNRVKPSQKRRKIEWKEEDEDDEEFTPSNDEEDDEDEDDDFMGEEEDSLDEEESRVKRKKTNTKTGKRVLRKKSGRGRKRRKRSMAPKKPARKKSRKSCGFRRKVRSDDDGDFIDSGLVLREQGETKRGPKRRRFVVDSDSDFAPSPSNDYEYTISEEEREQVREAEEFCRVKADLRSSSMPEKIQLEVLQVERKPKGRKGKEKVEEEEVKTEVAKRVCGICLSEEDKRRVRGTINCCAHYFCFTCISEWAKVESRCPLCKQRFNTISKRARSSAIVDLRVVTIQVPERDQVYQPTEDELRSYLYPYEDVICSECHQGGHDDLMLLCDECDSSAHTFCVGLGHEVPEGSWFCRDCKPLDPESPSSPVQTHLSDQRLANNASINRASAVINDIGEGFDLNSVSSQGLVGGLTSPRQQLGGFQGTMPLAGAGASTLSGRIRLRHQIHHCLSERPDRPEGNFASSQLDQARDATNQQGSTQFLVEIFSESQSPMGQDTDLLPPSLSHPVRVTGQTPYPTTILSGLTNGAIRPGLEERNSLLGYEQQLCQCNMIPINGCERQEVDFHTAKEQLQLTVKSHLKNLSRGSDLAQSKLEEIAKCSTQTILVTCGLENRSNEVVVMPVSPPPTCSHIELIAAGKPSLARDCCSSCFDSFVGDVVKKIFDAKLSEVQQWLCLAL